MFKLKNLAIYSNGIEKKKVPFGDITYIYGANKRGKTLILRLIDFVLSSSDNLLANDAQGLEKIDSASLEVITENGRMTFLRDKDNIYSYKIEDGFFIQVSKENYDSFISGFLCNSSNDTLKKYKMVFGEKLSFRALTFINFLEESGIGNLARVFTETSHVKHFFRAPDIFQFAFEQDKMQKLTHLEEQLEKKETELKSLNTTAVEFEFYISSLQSLLKKYTIPYSNDMARNIEKITEFKETFSSASSPSDSDLNYLLYQSNELSNQIRAQRELETQSNKIISRIDAFTNLANDIKKIFGKSQYASDYLDEIDRIIEEDSDAKTILSLKDYDATIKTLKKIKKEYDAKIKTIKNTLSDRSIEEKTLDATIMLNFCKKIAAQPRVNESKIIESEIASIKEDIKTIKKEIRNAFDELNERITSKYLSTENSNLIDEEKKKSKFTIFFDYKTISSFGEYRDADNKKHTFLPGSSAKMAYWQLCIYLETIKFFKQSLPEMPLLNLLVADGINQPFDDDDNKENYLSTLRSIINSYREYGLQAIVISTDTNEAIESTIRDVGVFYNIGNGLNPLH